VGSGVRRGGRDEDGVRDEERGTNEESRQGENVCLMGGKSYEHDDDIDGVVNVSSEEVDVL